MEFNTVAEFIHSQPESEYIEVRKHDEDTLWIVGEFGGDNPTKVKLEKQMNSLREALQKEYPTVSPTTINNRDTLLWFGISR